MVPFTIWIGRDTLLQRYTGYKLNKVEEGNFFSSIIKNFVIGYVGGSALSSKPNIIFNFIWVKELQTDLMPASHFYHIPKKSTKINPEKSYQMTAKGYETLTNSLTGQEAHLAAGAEKSEIFIGILQVGEDKYHLFGKWLSTLQCDGIFVGNHEKYGTFKLELLEETRTHLRLDFPGTNVRS
jgi:hypothetical protein